MEFISNQFLHNDIRSVKNFTYRTEFYLEQREKQYGTKTCSSTITTWKNLKYQKRIFDNDQAEIDRVISTMDSIHGTFNRSLLIPYNKIYSSLYGDDDESTHLMKTFCQRQDYYMNNNDDSSTQDTSSSFGNLGDSDFDDDDEEEIYNNEKKNSYDSGYRSVIPKRPISRESLIKMTQPLQRTLDL